MEHENNNIEGDTDEDVEVEPDESCTEEESDESDTEEDLKESLSLPLSWREEGDLDDCISLCMNGMERRSLLERQCQTQSRLPHISKTPVAALDRAQNLGRYTLCALKEAGDKNMKLSDFEVAEVSRVAGATKHQRARIRGNSYFEARMFRRPRYLSAC